MRLGPFSRYGFALAICFLVAGFVQAESPPDPLRLIPAEADAIVKIENPRRLLDVVLELDFVKSLQQLQPIREVYDSAYARRFFQFVSYFEKQLGAPWPELADRLAGGGAALAAKFRDGKPPAALLVIQSRDEKLLRKFFEMARNLFEQELARTEAKEKLQKTVYREIEAAAIPNAFAAAIIDSALVVTNSADVLKHTIDVYRDHKEAIASKASVKEARQLLPKAPLAWAWLDLAIVRQAPDAKALLAEPNNNPAITVFLGGWLDLARRSSFACAGLYRYEDRLYATLRAPKGREGMPSELATHVPPANESGALPVLEPKGVVFSTSYYLDVGKFWEFRNKVFNAEIAKHIEDFDKRTIPFFPKNWLSKLLKQAGPHQRFVAVVQPKGNYGKTIPGFNGQIGYGFVLDMRDPNFGKSIDAIVRAGAIFLSTRIKLKPVEEKYKDVAILGYRIDGNDVRLPAGIKDVVVGLLPSPSLALTGNQLIVTTNLELCKELVDIVQQEAKSGNKPASEVSGQTRLYAAGGAAALKASEDQLFTQNILTQALDPKEAKDQVRQLIELVQGLGQLRLESVYGNRDFHYDLIYLPPKNKVSKEAKTK
jgi:hypothetical protein